jgi:hypothetical protein
MTAPSKTDAQPAKTTPRRARTTSSAVATTKATKRPGATETAVAVKKEAPTVPAPKREIADEKTRKELALRLAHAKESGWSRPQLAELAFGSADAHYPVWRFQESSRGGYAEHVDALILACTKIETGEASLPERAARTVAAGPTKIQLAEDCAKLRSTIESVRSLLDSVAQSQGRAATEKERILARRVLGLLGTDDKDE